MQVSLESESTQFSSIFSRRRCCRCCLRSSSIRNNSTFLFVRCAMLWLTQILGLFFFTIGYTLLTCFRVSFASTFSFLFIFLSVSLIFRFNEISKCEKALRMAKFKRNALDTFIYTLFHFYSFKASHLFNLNEEPLCNNFNFSAQAIHNFSTKFYILFHTFSLSLYLYFSALLSITLCTIIIYLMAGWLTEKSIGSLKFLRLSHAKILKLPADFHLFCVKNTLIQ